MILLHYRLLPSYVTDMSNPREFEHMGRDSEDSLLSYPLGPKVRSALEIDRLVDRVANGSIRTCDTVPDRDNLLGCTLAQSVG
jgi:hypothetical protein